MYIRPQLREFQSSAKQQQATVQNMNMALKLWKDSQLNSHQRNILQKTGGAQNIQECIDILSQLFHDHHWIHEMIGSLCDIQRQNPFAILEMRSTKSKHSKSLLLHQNEKTSLNLVLMKPNVRASNTLKPSSFLFGPDHIVMAFLKYDDDVKYQTARLDNDDGLIINDHLVIPQKDTIVSFDNRETCLHIQHSKHAILFLRAVIKRNAFDRDEFDHHENDSSAQNRDHHCREYFANKSITPYITTADEYAFRAQLMLSILRTSGRKDSAPFFLHWLHSPAHDMRWYAMRELLAFDIETALPHLIQMAQNDDHIEVIKAASNTLIFLQTKYPQLFQAGQNHIKEPSLCPV